LPAEELFAAATPYRAKASGYHMKGTVPAVSAGWLNEGNMLFKRKTAEEKISENANKFIINYNSGYIKKYGFTETILHRIILDNTVEKYIKLYALNKTTDLIPLIKKLPVNSEIREAVKGKFNNDILYYSIIYSWKPDLKNDYGWFLPDINKSYKFIEKSLTIY
jgi:hypothetical protein